MIDKIVLIIILFIFWAFFAGTETAFVCTSKFKLNNLKKQGRKSAYIAYTLLKRPEKLLTTSLIGTNISLVLAANITSILFSGIFGRPAPVASVIAITLSSLIFCEIIPKNLALKHSLQITLLSAFPMYIFYILFYPIGWLFAFLSKMMIRLTGISYTGFSPGIFSKKEDVKVFLTASLKKRFTKDERRFFVDSLDFGTKELSDIMVPLVEIHALPSTAKVKNCYHFISKYKKFYIPIYNERIDNITGIIYTHDLFGVDKSLSISSLIKEPVFIPENKNINELYRELYEKDIPIVFAVDEHGGVTGMGTVYDIGEEIIGKVSSIEDRKNLIIKIRDGEYLCDGDVEIDEVNNILSLEIDTVDFTTLNGLILKKLGKIPEKKDFTDYDGYRFIVEKSNKKRAELIRVTALKGIKKPRK